MSQVEKLRTVVAATGEVREPGVAQAAAQLAGEAPAISPRVVATRTMHAERARSSGLRTLFLLLALIALGAAGWYYRDPLVAFGTELMATVETEMDRIRAADESPAAPSADAPLTQAPAVIDDTPATVVADDAGRTVVTEPSALKAAAPEAAPAAAPADAAPTATVPQPKRQVPAGPAPVPQPKRQVSGEPAPVPQPTRQGPASAPVPADSAPVTAAPARVETGPVRFAFERQALSVREGDVAARIVIRRSGDSSGTAEVSWSTADGTAVADRDYADLGARIERFTPGESSRTIDVLLTNDAVAEPARSFPCRSKAARRSASTSSTTTERIMAARAIRRVPRSPSPPELTSSLREDPATSRAPSMLRLVWGRARPRVPTRIQRVPGRPTARSSSDCGRVSRAGLCRWRRTWFRHRSRP